VILKISLIQSKVEKSKWWTTRG